MFPFRNLFVVACLAAVGCSSGPATGEKIDPALASLVPADTVTLIGIRMEALRATPAYKKWIATRPMPFVDQFAKETGLDPRKDLWEMLVVSDGKETVMMARGQFSPNMGEEPRLNRPGVTRTPYKGYTLIGNQDGVVTFLNASTAVAGKPAAVRSIIDQRGRSGIPAALLAKVSSIPAANQIWAVSTGGIGQIQGAAPHSGNMANLDKIFSMIENVTAAADLRTGLNAFANAQCKTEQDATSLSDALTGLIGLARLSTPDNQPEMLRAFDDVHVQKQQRTVGVQAQIPENLLDKVIERLQAMQQRR